MLEVYTLQSVFYCEDTNEVAFHHHVFPPAAIACWNKSVSVRFLFPLPVQPEHSILSDWEGRVDEKKDRLHLESLCLRNSVLCLRDPLLRLGDECHLLDWDDERRWEQYFFGAVLLDDVVRPIVVDLFACRLSLCWWWEGLGMWSGEAAFGRYRRTRWSHQDDQIVKSQSKDNECQ